MTVLSHGTNWCSLWGTNCIFSKLQINVVFKGLKTNFIPHKNALHVLQKLPNELKLFIKMLFRKITAVYSRNHSKNLQGDSIASDPKLLSIKNYVIEIITWKFMYTYRDRCKTGPAHNRCWNWSPFTSKHTSMRFSKFWNTFPKMSTLTAWISWRITSLSYSIVRGVFL